MAAQIEICKIDRDRAVAVGPAQHLADALITQRRFEVVVMGNRPEPDDGVEMAAGTRDRNGAPFRRTRCSGYGARSWPIGRTYEAIDRNESEKGTGGNIVSSVGR